MVLDTSALLAILFDEPERHRFVRLIDADSTRLMSVVNWVEAGLVVLGRKRKPGLEDLDRFVGFAAVERGWIHISSATPELM